MAYDKQLDITFRHFKNRILELEKAADAQDRALKQLAEKTGVEIDLTRMPTPEEVSKQEQEEKAAPRLQEDKTIIALLRKSEQNDVQ